MGYGLDTEKFPERKWGRTITWSAGAGSDLSKVQALVVKPIEIWKAALGISINYARANADFEIVLGERDQWVSGGKGNGRPPIGTTGKLLLTETASTGTVLHEMGHMLGLTHEHDHSEHRAAYYKGPNDFGFMSATANAKINKEYSAYNPASIMNYPSSKYEKATAPHQDDIDTIKKINGWEGSTPVKKWPPVATAAGGFRSTG